MGKAKLFLTLAVIFLLFVSGLLGVNQWMQSSSMAEAERLSDAVLDYLRDKDVRCDADSSEFAAVTACFRTLTDRGPGDVLEEEEFENADDDEKGYVLLKNTGEDAFASGNFTLLMNKQVMDEQCRIDGTIGPGYVCRLDFTDPCEPGDALEVSYNGERVYLKTC